jgi:hypothetical protein
MVDKFEEVYRIIATRKNYVQPNYPRMDSWAIDLYERADGMFAGMSDAGYSRWVGKKVDGKVVWRVSDYYPKPLEFSGISVDEFKTLSV